MTGLTIEVSCDFTEESVVSEFFVPFLTPGDSAEAQRPHGQTYCGDTYCSAAGKVTL